MNLQKPHPKDALIDLEVEALRAVDSPVAGLARSIETMCSGAVSFRPRRYVWSVGLATAAITAAMVVVPFANRQALAAELRVIAAKQRAQQTRFCKSYQRGPDGVLILSYEEWLDGEKHSTRFYNTQGELSGASGFNGEKNFLYWAPIPDSGQSAGGLIDDCGSDQIPLETVDTYMNIAAIKEFERKPQIQENGKRYDHYWFGRGMFRLMVDPETRLPVRREVYSKGHLIERDFYEYPVAIASTTFQAPQVQGVEFYDYPANRAKLLRRLDSPAAQKRNGIELKVVIVGANQVLAIWTGNSDSKQSRLEIPGIQGWTGGVRSAGNGYKVSTLHLKPGTNLGSRFDMRVSIPDEGKTASFRVVDPLRAPWPERLVWRPVPGAAQVAATSNE